MLTLQDIVAKIQNSAEEAQCECWRLHEESIPLLMRMRYSEGFRERSRHLWPYLLKTLQYGCLHMAVKVVSELMVLVAHEQERDSDSDDDLLQN